MTIFVYTRVSTQGQAEKGDSIEGQIKRCQGWVMMEGLDDANVEVIEEKAVSGSKPFKERPEGSKVYEKLQKDDLIICYRLDRMFRNALDTLQSIEDFKIKDVGLVLMDIAHKDIIRDSIGKMMLQVVSAFAEMERERIMDRMNEGKASKLAKGFWMGGRPPFGYKLDKKKEGTRLIENPETMPDLKFILEAQKYGISLRQIEKEVNGLNFAAIGKIINKQTSEMFKKVTENE